MGFLLDRRPLGISKLLIPMQIASPYFPRFPATGSRAGSRRATLTTFAVAALTRPTDAVGVYGSRGHRLAAKLSPAVLQSPALIPLLRPAVHRQSSRSLRSGSAEPLLLCPFTF